MLDGCKTVLVVDDYEAHRYAAKRTLEAAGFAVLTAATGGEALTAARRHPDLIVLDVGLPDMTGFDVCRLLRGDVATKDIPVVFMSASHTDTSAVDVGTASGAHAYLFHPATREELLTVIMGALAKAAVDNKSASTATTAATDNRSRPHGRSE